MKKGERVIAITCLDSVSCSHEDPCLNNPAPRESEACAIHQEVKLFSEVNYSMAKQEELRLCENRRDIAREVDARPLIPKDAIGRVAGYGLHSSNR